MTVAVYDGPNGNFIGQAYTLEELWAMANLALRRTQCVWLHGRVAGMLVNREFNKTTLYEQVIESQLPTL